MRLVVDANILVGEIVRPRGRRLLNDHRIELFLAERALHEAEHELRKRLSVLLRSGRLPDDWHSIALAMAVDAAIWTMDGDFLGCGIGTWTTDTLLSYLEHDAPEHQ